MTPALYQASDSRYPPVDQLVCGVFKGGGAKGLVYCSALHELRARGIWFASVAGSSAGAITATMIAAGHTPPTILELADEAFVEVKRNWLRWVSTDDRALFRTDRLRTWIERKLRAAVSRDDEGPDVTFAELSRMRDAIDLNVVAMNLATKQPVVFNSTSTPDVSVTTAVLASSAIPVAMRPQRMGFARGPKRSAELMVDGGTYANYPMFVYRDLSFRAFNRLSPVVVEQPVVGFTIETAPYTADGAEDIEWPPPPPVEIAPDAESPRVFDMDPRRSRFDLGGGRRMGAVGAVLSWSSLRWLVSLLGLGLATVGLFLWWRSVAADEYQSLAEAPEVLRPAAEVGLYLAVVLVVTAAVAFAVGLLRLLGEVVDTGMPAFAAALGVGPGVPAWVGFHESDLVVRLSAPLDIETTTFTPGPVARRLALVVAGAQASTQLDELFPLSRRAPDDEVPPVGSFLDRDGDPRPDDAAYAGLLTRWTSRRTPKPPDGATTFVVVFWWWLLASVATYFVSVGDQIFGLVITAPFVWFLVRRMVRGRRSNQNMTSDVASRRPFLGRLVGGVILAGLGLLLADAVHSDAFSDSELVLRAAIGLMLIGGLGSMASAVARILANRALKAHQQELAVGHAAAIE